jgi:hypothetical protein
MKKPWAGDAYLSETFQRVVRGKLSVSRLIYNSKLFRATFQAKARVANCKQYVFWTVVGSRNPSSHFPARPNKTKQLLSKASA